MKRIKVVQDLDCESPRTSRDNVAVFCTTSRSFIGDCEITDKDAAQETIDAVQADGGYVTPLYLFRHSGDTISTSPFSCPWDSGQCGFVYVTKEKMDEECPKDRDPLEWAEAMVEAEVKEMDMCLRGDVWGWVLYESCECPNCGDEHENVIDSCWGYVGYEYCVESAKLEHPDIPVDKED